MTIDHIAIWTDNLEHLREYYVNYFGGISGKRYTNRATQLSSYFISFQSGARLEIMSKPGIPDNINDTIVAQHKGIIHMAFGVESQKEVDEKAKQIQAAGYSILRGPRKTGDSYYEFETLDPDNNRIEVTTKYIG
jgi:lactoylglutathione lyase